MPDSLSKLSRRQFLLTAGSATAISILANEVSSGTSKAYSSVPSPTPQLTRSTKSMRKRLNYYKELAADYSKAGLVSDEMKAKLISLAQELISKKEAELPQIGPGYLAKQVEKENKEWWPTHCEALRQGRGDLLTAEYRNDLVYLCQDGHYVGLTEQQEREQHWWALISQPGVTMCWPIVMFHDDVTYFEWKSVDDETGETIAKGNVTFLRRGHRGGVYLKTEQLTFYRDVYASSELLKLITV